MRSNAPCLYAMKASLAEPRLNSGATAEPGNKYGINLDRVMWRTQIDLYSYCMG